MVTMNEIQTLAAKLQPGESLNLPLTVKLRKDGRTLSQIHSQLMQDILACDNQILGEDEFDQNEYDLAEEQSELRSEMEQMCEELGTLEEVMSLKWAVDCDCFYQPTMFWE